MLLFKTLCICMAVNRKNEYSFLRSVPTESCNKVNPGVWSGVSSDCFSSCQASSVFILSRLFLRLRNPASKSASAMEGKGYRGIKTFRSIIHVLIIAQVLPVHCIAVIVVVFFFGFVEVVEDSVDDPADSSGVFTNLFKCLDGFFVFRRIFFWCHFRMITW